jgi:hypothetical protein
MKIKIVFPTILAVVTGAAVCCIIFANRQPSSPEGMRNTTGNESALQQDSAKPAPVVATIATAPPLVTPGYNIKVTVPPSAAIVRTNAPQRVRQTRTAPQTKEEIKDPVARVALGFVGSDPEAEAHWIGAINDPGLSADERQNLIEDLNEDGLSDPKHPGPENLPLILNRIQLIEELAPDAMDQVNADAFREAYKDLVNMLQGRPVQ